MGLETGTYLNDLVVTNPVGASDLKQYGDDHLRLVKTVLKNTFPNMTGAFGRVVNKNINYTILSSDASVLFLCNALATYSLPAAASVGNGFSFTAVNTDTTVDPGPGPTLTIDPSGAELISGASTITVMKSQGVRVTCTGTAWVAEYFWYTSPLDKTNSWNGTQTFVSANISLLNQTGLASLNLVGITGGLTVYSGGVNFNTPVTISAFTMFHSAVIMKASASDLASGATIDLGAVVGNLVHISGTTTTTAVTMYAGQQTWCIADAAWPLTYHATNLKLNTGGANYTCAAGDRILFMKDAAGVVYGTIHKQDGTAVV